MERADAIRLAYEELNLCRKKFRCKILDKYQVSINTRLISTSGRCDCRKRLIEFSAKYIWLDSDKEILDTIRHEIAHAIEDWDRKRKGLKHEDDHNSLFYEWCKKVGCRPMRYGPGLLTVLVSCSCSKLFHSRIPPNIHTDEEGRIFYYKELKWVFDICKCCGETSKLYKDAKLVCNRKGKLKRIDQ